MKNYNSQGFSFPHVAMSSREAEHCFKKYIQLEQKYDTGTIAFKTHTALPWVRNVCLKPEILDVIELLLGPNILCWSSTFFTKKPDAGQFVSMHEDSLYFQPTEPDNVASIWIALNPAKQDTGCLEYVPGSHRQNYSHQHVIDKDNLLPKGQTVNGTFNTVPVELNAGEFTAHHIKLLHKRTMEKAIDYGPTELELVSAGLPSIDLYKKYFGSYTEACEEIGVKPLLGSKLPKEFFNDYSNVKILIDTREQQPLKFKNSELYKSDVGDYSVESSDYNYTHVDRKSFGDFCGTITSGYARFCKELDRCRSLGCYMFVVMEFSLEEMQELNKKSYKKYKLDYVFHNMRDIQKQYKDCCQFVFAGSREMSQEIIPKLLIIGKDLWHTDVNYFWSKYLKEK